MKTLALFIIFSITGSVWALNPRDYRVDEIQVHFNYHSYQDSILTLDEKETIKTYQKRGYRHINMYLRNAHTRDERELINIKQSIQMIDKSIAKVSYLPDVLLYRGFSMNLRQQRKYKLESIIHAKAFTSTSLSRYMAEGFSFYGDGTPNVLIIYNNNGMHGLFLDETEQEIILPRNNYYKVMKKREKNNIQYNLLYRCKTSSCASAVLPDTLPWPFS